MAAKGKQQWDFGELFAEGAIEKEPRPAKKKSSRKKAATKKATAKITPPVEPEIDTPVEGEKASPFSVTSLTRHIKSTLEDGLGRISVTGEITNLRSQASGHKYFTLKDEGAQLSCVLFRGTKVSNKSLLDDGMEVVLRGQLSVYAPRGQYQLIVSGVELKGTGALQVAFERLKAKLDEEGLFDSDRKQEIPPCPQAIGIVTSETGAAIQDVLHVIERRDTGLEIFVFPSLVQGETAAASVANAISALNRFSIENRPLDLILITRGGGSLEDLWAFNEEPVARAIASSDLPVISAIGHEIDFTISDFTADFRAATPSAAAELITATAFAARDRVEDHSDYIRQIIDRRIDQETDNLKSLHARLKRSHPQRRINDHLQRLDELTTRLSRATRSGLNSSRQTLSQEAERLKSNRPNRRIEELKKDLNHLQHHLLSIPPQRIGDLKQKMSQAQNSLKLLSPQNTLDRGYSITTDAETGELLRSASDTKPGQQIETKTGKGTILSTIDKSLSKET